MRPKAVISINVQSVLLSRRSNLSSSPYTCIYTPYSVVLFIGSVRDSTNRDGNKSQQIRQPYCGEGFQPSSEALPGGGGWRKGFFGGWGRNRGGWRPDQHVPLEFSLQRLQNDRPGIFRSGLLGMGLSPGIIRMHQACKDGF